MNAESLYKKIIVIGSGKTAAKILQYLSERQSEYGYEIEYIEYANKVFGSVNELCEQSGIVYHNLTDNNDIVKYFNSIKDKSLVISAGNFYLFPDVITKNPLLTIINFHNALLPKFAGRNAPSWAIFENEKVTGITWHYVTNEIDGGDIIINKKFEMPPDIKAYELVDKLIELACTGFCEIFDDIITGRAKSVKQEITGQRRIYKSSECPGNCEFSLNDSPEYIYRLLRSADYWKYNVLPPVTTVYEGKKIVITNYKKVAEPAPQASKKLFLPFDESQWLMLSYKYTD